MGARVATLMFHSLATDARAQSAQSTAEAFYSLSSDLFRTCLQLIQNQHAPTLTTRELERGDAGVAITFDDGWESDFTVALPELLSRQMRAISFVITDWIGKDGFVSKAQLREMVRHGMEVQLHGKTHRFLADLPEIELRMELSAAKARLEDILGQEVTALSYPGGRGGSRERLIAGELGFRHFFCSRPGWYRGHGSEIPRMVVHRGTSVADIEYYLAGRPGHVLRQSARYYLGRTLRTLLGSERYEKLKSSGQRG